MEPANAARPLIELAPVISRAQTLPDQVYAILKHRILTCRLLPAERVIEKDLCAEIGVSRTPLREALNRLGLEGLITLEPYKGYKVAPVTLEEIRNLCELRAIVESESAALAAQRATPEEVDRLASLAKLRYTPGDRETYENYLRANSAFHLALVRCTHNPRLEAIVASVIGKIQRPLYLGLDVGLDADEATAEHIAIVGAVRERNPRRARRLMREQITLAKERMIAALASLGSDVDSALGSKKTRQRSQEK